MGTQRPLRYRQALSLSTSTSRRTATPLSGLPTLTGDGKRLLPVVLPSTIHGGEPSLYPHFLHFSTALLSVFDLATHCVFSIPQRFVRKFSSYPSYQNRPAETSDSSVILSVNWGSLIVTFCVALRSWPVANVIHLQQRSVYLRPLTTRQFWTCNPERGIS